MIDKASEEELKSRIDIVDIISNYIEIKKAGANYKANCPFHGEKTASFVISPTKQIYHCFGCGVGGDAIQFVKEYEKLNYPEALEKIASIMNFSLSYTKGSDNHSEIRHLLEQIQSWYRKNLDKSDISKKYLNNRGLNQQSIEKFGIGFVGSNQEVMNFLNQNFLPIPKAKEAGVVAQRDNGRFYARLTERITFPIYSPSGAIVGFGGRTITNHPAKYINSPQTKLFNKSKLLYGYSKAKESIYKNKKIIITEGYLDVIMLHQAGFNEAVATLGTALTKEHLPILRKGDPHIILAYDGDKAGVNAALKASTILTQSGFDGFVVLFPNGADPADMIAQNQIQKVAELLRDGQPLIPFVLEMTTKSYNLQNPKEKEIAFEAIKAYLNSLSPILKESYISYSATLLGVSPALFNSSTKLENIKSRFSSPKDDIGELSIIKTVLENKNLIDTLLEVAEPAIFGNYSALLESIIRGDGNNPNLIGLMIDDNIKVMKEDEFKKALAFFLVKHYTQKLKSISSDNSISLTQKSFLIRKIKMDIIPQLKRGELVVFKV